jgi:2-dehydro-3-deoxyphosphogluconate aldolase/(4S)-4-hydroxy-2-oxoglutarate aldolase
MTGLARGYDHFKFFPAGPAGGVKMLQAFAGPFPRVTFCPTGGISSANYREYLALPNVACVGGSWVVPQGAIDQGDWAQITALAREAVAGAGR